MHRHRTACGAKGLLLDLGTVTTDAILLKECDPVLLILGGNSLNAQNNNAAMGQQNRIDKFPIGISWGDRAEDQQ